jgi:hypothetical protein
MTTEAGRFSVMWPRGRRVVPVESPAARPASLDGKTVAFLWDYLFRGDQVFRILEGALRERFKNIRFIGYETFGNTHSGDERRIVAALPDRLRALGVDAAISGMGC